MLNEFGRTAILLGFAVMFPSLPLMASVLFRVLKVRPEAPDPIKMETELGWQPQYSALDDIVRSAWIWHQQRYGEKAHARA